METEAQIRASLATKMETSGERERLKGILRAKLVECGWRDELKAYATEILRTRGVDNVTAEDLIEEITPYGKQQVPDDVKLHLVQQIRDFFSREAGKE